MTNYYNILGVDKNATADEIKKAYRKLALQWHPDKHSDKSKEEAKKKFQEISQAYNTLSNEEKRKHYDMFGSDPDNMDSMGESMRGMGSKVRFTTGGIPANFADDLFRSFFGTEDVFEAENDIGNMRGFQHFYSGPKTRDFSQFHMRETPRKTIEKNLECSLNDLYTGTTKYVTINSHTESVTVKPGTKEGTKYTYDTQFKNIILILTVKEIPHDKIKRINNDLSVTLNITLKEALEGFTKNIELLDGQIETIKLNSIPSSDYIHKIENKGMPIRKKGENIGKGNLLINFIIDFTHQ